MKTISLSPKLNLPLDIVTQTIAVLAKRRAGKSYTMRKIVEQLFEANQQVVLIDPKGDQWGIRSAADGKSPGLPIIILGGERGDSPLEPSAGEIVAKLVAEERLNVLLDLSMFRKHEVATFMTGFLENLYRIKAKEQFRTPMMLVIDEADAIAPQKPQKGEERMLGAAEDIVRRGGQRGIGTTLVTQRSAVLNKNVLTQAQVMIALRTIAPQDLDAMNAWIDVHGTAEQKKTLMASLPSLPIGDAWVWSPGWPTADGIFQRIHVSPIETYDSGATPKPGESRREPKSLADVNLDALKKHMADAIERKKADDPKELRKRIATLEAMIKQLGTTPIADKNAYQRGIDDTRSIVETTMRVVCARVSGMKDHASALMLQLESLEKAATDYKLDETMKLNETARNRQPKVIELEPSPRYTGPRHVNPPAPKNYKCHTQPMYGTIPEGERKILTAAAQCPGGADRPQLTVLTGYKRSTRDAYIQRLREKGYVSTNGDKVLATASGFEALGDFQPLPTGHALQQYWLNRLPDGESKILRLVIDAYPNSVQRDALTEATGYQRSTRDAYIQRMAAKKIVVAGRGEVTAAETLFD